MDGVALQKTRAPPPALPNAPPPFDPIGDGERDPSIIRGGGGGAGAKKKCNLCTPHL